MARPNTLGNSFLGLGLERDEEDRIKKYIGKKGKDISGKQFMRFLVRQYMETDVFKKELSKK